MHESRWERPGKLQGVDKIQKKSCNDLKIFFKLAVSYLQQADVRSTAYYSDTVSLQSNTHIKCMRGWKRPRKLQGMDEIQKKTLK
jgi:hypothetical protein